MSTQLITAGVDTTQYPGASTKKFCLLQVYEYAKDPGGMSVQRAEEVLEDESERINTSSTTFKKCKAGKYAGGGDSENMMDMMDFPEEPLLP
jgi:hypothetical protein